MNSMNSFNYEKFNSVSSSTNNNKLPNFQNYSSGSFTPGPYSNILGSMENKINMHHSSQNINSQNNISPPYKISNSNGNMDLNLNNENSNPINGLSGLSGHIAHPYMNNFNYMRNHQSHQVHPNSLGHNMPYMINNDPNNHNHFPNYVQHHNSMPINHNHQMQNNLNPGYDNANNHSKEISRPLFISNNTNTNNNNNNNNNNNTSEERENKVNKMRAVQNYTDMNDEELAKHCYVLAKDQGGCRFLQKKIDENKEFTNIFIFPRVNIIIFI